MGEKALSGQFTNWPQIFPTLVPAFSTFITELDHIFVQYSSARRMQYSFTLMNPGFSSEYRSWRDMPASRIKPRIPELTAAVKSRIAKLISCAGALHSATVIPENTTEPLPALISGWSYQVLRIRANQELRRDTRLRIRFPDEATAEGEVEACKKVGNLHEASVRLRDVHFGPDGNDSRIEPRQKIELSAVLRVGGDPDKECSVRVLDFSSTGLRIHAPVSLPPGTAVEIQTGDASIQATVRYSREVDTNEFRMGMEADKSCRISFADGKLSVDA